MVCAHAACRRGGLVVRDIRVCQLVPRTTLRIGDVAVQRVLARRARCVRRRRRVGRWRRRRRRAGRRAWRWRICWRWGQARRRRRWWRRNALAYAVPRGACRGTVPRHEGVLSRQHHTVLAPSTAVGMVAVPVFKVVRRRHAIGRDRLTVRPLPPCVDCAVDAANPVGAVGCGQTADRVPFGLRVEDGKSTSAGCARRLCLCVALTRLLHDAQAVKWGRWRSRRRRRRRRQGGWRRRRSGRGRDARWWLRRRGITASARPYPPTVGAASGSRAAVDAVYDHLTEIA
jgi:hypothetical protein